MGIFPLSDNTYGLAAPAPAAGAGVGPASTGGLLLVKKYSIIS